MTEYNADRFATQRKSSEWRSRTRSHYHNIADLLKQRAEQGLGVRSSELYREPERYGRSPRNRISELRQHGWNIGSKPYADSDWFYWLRSDASGRQYPTQRFDDPPKAPRPQLVSQPDIKHLPNSPDWYEREHGPRPPVKPSVAEPFSKLPLFETVQR